MDCVLLVEVYLLLTLVEAVVVAVATFLTCRATSSFSSYFSMLVWTAISRDRRGLISNSLSPLVSGNVAWTAKSLWVGEECTNALENCLRTRECLAGTTVVPLDSASVVVSVFGSTSPSVVDSFSLSTVVSVPAVVLAVGPSVGLGVLVSSTIVHIRLTQAAVAPSSSQSASTTQASFFSESKKTSEK